ncbi:hypothetical protein SLA2020_205120 [Shorea laevis]
MEFSSSLTYRPKFSDLSFSSSFTPFPLQTHLQPTKLTKVTEPPNFYRCCRSSRTPEKQPAETSQRACAA